MAIQATVTIKGVTIASAYISLMAVGGGKMQKVWSGRLGVFANSDLARIREVMTKAAVPAVPAVPAIPATDENPSVPEVPEIPEQPAEYEYLNPDPIATFDVSVPYSADELNPYVLLYAKAKTLPQLSEVEDV